MQLSLFLVAVSFCSYSFLGWYVLRLAPKAELNRSYSGLCFFVAAWTFLQFAFAAPAGAGFDQRWYANELFSYAPKTLLVLLYSLRLTGVVKRYPRALFAAQAAFAGIACLLGLAYLAGLEPGIAAYRLLSGTGAAPASALVRGAYAVISVGQDAAAFVLIAIWHRRTRLRRERNMALFHLGLGVAVVAVIVLLGLVKVHLGEYDVEAILILQIAQPFAVAYAIAHFQVLRSADTILSAHIKSQLAYAIAVLDAESRLISVNAAAEELSGMGEAELLGRPASALFGPGAESLAGPSNRETRYIERGLPGPEGTETPMSLALTPLCDAWGDYLGHVVIGQPLRRLEERRESLGLSAREREVCLHLVQGLSNQEIADRLFISPGTVKNHVYNIYEKTQVKNRVELARLLG